MRKVRTGEVQERFIADAVAVQSIGVPLTLVKLISKVRLINVTLDTVKMVHQDNFTNVFFVQN